MFTDFLDVFWIILWIFFIVNSYHGHNWTHKIALKAENCVKDGIFCPKGLRALAKLEVGPRSMPCSQYKNVIEFWNLNILEGSYWCWCGGVDVFCLGGGVGEWPECCIVTNLVGWYIGQVLWWRSSCQGNHIQLLASPKVYIRGLFIRHRTFSNSYPN